MKLVRRCGTVWGVNMAIREFSLPMSMILCSIKEQVWTLNRIRVQVKSFLPACCCSDWRGGGDMTRSHYDATMNHAFTKRLGPFFSTEVNFRRLPGTRSIYNNNWLKNKFSVWSMGSQRHWEISDVPRSFDTFFMKMTCCPYCNFIGTNSA
jgi:hypothetical protein